MHVRLSVKRVRISRRCTWQLSSSMRFSPLSILLKPDHLSRIFISEQVVRRRRPHVSCASPTTSSTIHLHACRGNPLASHYSGGFARAAPLQVGITRDRKIVVQPFTPPTTSMHKSKPVSRLRRSGVTQMQHRKCTLRALQHWPHARNPRRNAVPANNLKSWSCISLLQTA